MSTQTVKIIDNSAHAIFSFLEDGDYHPRDFAVRPWDGSILNPETGQPPRIILVLQHSGSLRRVLSPANELTMGEAYIYDDIDIEGYIQDIFALAEYLNDRLWGVTERVRFLKRPLSLPSDGRARPARQYLPGTSLQAGSRSERAAANTVGLVSKFLITAISSHREHKFG